MNAYDGLATEVAPLAVPVFLSETGGLNGDPRTWSIVPQMYTDDNLYPQLSGQVAFQMLEEGAGYGLYDVSESSGTVTLTASTDGGASDLSAAFASAANETLKPAATTPTTLTTAPTSAGSNPAVSISWPTELLPLKTYQAPNATITVENYATCTVQIVQSGMVMGTVSPAASGSQPVTAQIQVAAGAQLEMQGDVNGSWDAVCLVHADKVTDGMTVKNDVSWGANAACTIS